MPCPVLGNDVGMHAGGGPDDRPSGAFRFRHGAAIRKFGDRALLFIEDDQQIHELNDTALALASRISDGATLDQLEDTLGSLGSDEASNRAFATAFLLQMKELGLLVAVTEEDGRTDGEQTVRIAGVPMKIRYASRELFEKIAPAYRHLEARDDTSNVLSFTLKSDGPFTLLSADGKDAEIVDKESAAVILKGLLLETVLAKGDYLCALHGSALVKDGKVVLLMGQPGAGKSTMALTMSAGGHAYGGDDVTLVCADGRALGVCLAPAIKEPAWDLAQKHFEGLDDLPIHLRPDGLRVRFLPSVARPIDDPLPVSKLVVLDRDGSSSARASQLSTSEAITALMAEARSTDGRCSVDTFNALADIVSNAVCVRLQYGEASDGAAVIAGLDQ